VFRDCRILNPEFAAVYLDTYRSSGPRIVLENLNVRQDSATAPINFYLRPALADSAGNLAVRGCTLEAPNAAAPLDVINLSNGAGALEGVSGRVRFNGTNVDLAAFVSEREFDRTPPELHRKAIEPASLRPAGFPPAAPGGGARPLTVRGAADLLLYAEAGCEVSLDLEYVQMGDYATPPLELSATGPDGAPVPIGRLDYCMSQGREFRFVPRVGGSHVVSLAGGVNSVAIRRCSAPWSVALRAKRTTGNLLSPSTPLYFAVPAGTDAFTIEVAGRGGSARVGAELRVDGILAAEADGIVRSKFLTVKAPPADRPRLGSLTLRNAGLVYLQVPDPLPPYVATAPENVFVETAEVPSAGP